MGAKRMGCIASTKKGCRASMEKRRERGREIRVRRELGSSSESDGTTSSSANISKTTMVL